MNKKLNSLIRSLCTLVSLFLFTHISLAQGTWNKASVLGYKGAYGAGSAIIGNDIYVFGGATYQSSPNSVVKTMFTYDVNSDTWYQLTTSGNFTARQRFVSALVNGKIYAIWGDTSSSTGGISNALEVFDPATQTWSKVNAIGTVTPRRSAASVVYNDKIYIIGGTDGTKDFNNVDVFDPMTNTWSNLATSGTFTARMGLSACLYNGKIYTFGGGTNSGSVITPLDVLEILDPLTKTWSSPTKTGNFEARFGLKTMVLDNKIYTIGGSNYTGTTGGVINAFEIFDPATNSFTTPVTTSSFTRRNFPTAEIANNKIYVLGGSSGSSISYNVNEYYQPSSSGIEFNKLNEIQLSPNPCHGLFSIIISNPTSKETLEIYNTFGSLVFKEENLKESNSIDLSVQADGLYFVKVWSDKKIIAIQKVIKQ